MRPSKRSAILDAALAVIESRGLSGLTFDAVAAESGISKGGLLYHFASKEELLLAIHQHLAAAWEAELCESLGKPYAESSVEERVAAYIRTGTAATTRVELLLLVDALAQPAYLEPWWKVSQRWSIPMDPDADPETFRTMVSVLAADGLWIYELINGTRIGPEARRRMGERILSER